MGNVAALYGIVAASFAVEQIGVPRITKRASETSHASSTSVDPTTRNGPLGDATEGGNGSKEEEEVRWNGQLPRERLKVFRDRCTSRGVL